MRQLIIVTGLSGSGKSIVLRELEDCGYYCIDNLPATMVPDISRHLNAEHELVAISIDSRSASIDKLPEHVNTLMNLGFPTKVIYLESDVETLVETRRKHPLSSTDTTMAESISKERELLGHLSTLGHVIDTSHLSAKALRNWVKAFVQSPIQDFLQQHASVGEMRNDIQLYIEKWLPHFIEDNRSYLTIAIGCTGGQHRSVYFVEMLSAYFNDKQNILKRHRELS